MCDTSRWMSFELPRRRPALRFTGNLRSLGAEALTSEDIILEDDDDDAETRVGKTLEPPKVSLKAELGQPRKRTPLPSPVPNLVAKLPAPPSSTLAPPPSRRHVSPTRATVPAPPPARGPMVIPPAVILAPEIPPPPLRGGQQERVVIIPTPNSTRRRDPAPRSVRSPGDPEPSPWIGDETRNAPRRGMMGVMGRETSMSEAETLMIEREAMDRERARLAADQRAAQSALPVPHFRRPGRAPLEPTMLKRPPMPPPKPNGSYAAWILVAVIMGVVSFHLTPNAYAKIQAQRMQRQ